MTTDSNTVYIINSSPRKNWNTAKMCESFAQGVISKGGKAEIIHLYDIDFKGCRSCFACKLKGSPRFGKCSYPDGLQSVLEKVSHGGGLVLATPMYFGDVSAVMRAFIERLMFPFFQYDAAFTSTAPKKMPTAIIYTLNAAEEFVNNTPLGQRMKTAQDSFEFFAGHIFSQPDVITVYNTCQFDDYDKYAAECFNGEEKQKQREIQLPKEQQKAFNVGVKMAEKILNR